MRVLQCVLEPTHHAQLRIALPALFDPYCSGASPHESVARGAHNVPPHTPRASRGTLAPLCAGSGRAPGFHAPSPQATRGPELKPLCMPARRMRSYACVSPSATPCPRLASAWRAIRSECTQSATGARAAPFLKTPRSVHSAVRSAACKAGQCCAADGPELGLQPPSGWWHTCSGATWDLGTHRQEGHVHPCLAPAPLL